MKNGTDDVTLRKLYCKIRGKVNKMHIGMRYNFILSYKI